MLLCYTLICIHTRTHVKEIWENQIVQIRQYSLETMGIHVNDFQVESRCNRASWQQNPEPYNLHMILHQNQRNQLLIRSPEYKEQQMKRQDEDG